MLGYGSVTVVCTLIRRHQRGLLRQMQPLHMHKGTCWFRGTARNNQNTRSAILVETLPYKCSKPWQKMFPNPNKPQNLICVVTAALWHVPCPPHASWFLENTVWFMKELRKGAWSLSWVLGFWMKWWPTLSFSCCPLRPTLFQPLLDPCAFSHLTRPSLHPFLAPVFPSWPSFLFLLPPASSSLPLSPRLQHLPIFLLPY